MDSQSSKPANPAVRVSLCLFIALCATMPIACKHASTGCTQAHVGFELSERMAADLGPENCPGETAIPADVAFDDGLTEDEAVAVALWNNAAYRELLTQLGIADARLYDAGLLTDPQMTLFFPLGPKQLEFTVFFIVDAVWLRPIRERAASLDLANVSQTMVQNGLNVIRDTRLAHADLLFAQDRAKLADEAAALQKEIAEFADKRFKAGDIAKLESTTAEVESLRAQADAARFAQDVTLARNRLRTLLGLTLQDVSLSAVDGKPADLAERQSDDLVNEALAFRPDLRAAEINVQTACERTRLARWQFMNFDAVFDANGKGTRGFESGPGLRMTLPFLNANRGNVAIASEQVRQAQRQMITVRDQITLDVRTAFVQMQQARENLRAVREKMLPNLKTAVELARRNYQAGGATYFLVLQTTRQYLDLRIRELELELALRRAIAELERSVGHRLQTGNERSTNRPKTDSVVIAGPGTRRNRKHPLKVFPLRLQRVSGTSQSPDRQHRHALSSIDRFANPGDTPGRLRKAPVKERKEDGSRQSRQASL